MAVGSASKFGSPLSPAPGLRLLLLAGLSIFLLIVDHRNNHLDAVRKTIGATVYPLRVIVDAPVSIWRWANDATTTRNDLQMENSRLKAERLLTQARLQRYASLEAENARLRAMLEARSRMGNRVRVAEIMSASANPFRHVLVVDKGTNDDVYDGQTIVDANGVVGQIVKAGVLSSQAILISDPDHALPVEVNRNGLRTIAEGTGEFDRLDLSFLPNNADIQPGDLLVTSGLGGAFPAGYPVGVIESVVVVPEEPFAIVRATPAAALDQIREVMLVWTEDRVRDVASDDANNEGNVDDEDSSANALANDGTEEVGASGDADNANDGQDDAVESESGEVETEDEVDNDNE